MIQQTSTRRSRRDFLKAGTAAAGVVLAGGLSVGRSAHAAGAERIRVALIGCGGRGNGAVRNCMDADPAIQLVAVADAFPRQAQGSAQALRDERKDRVDLPTTGCSWAWTPTAGRSTAA